ncbi:MAG: nucleotidyltransferase family protein [Actinobacteria bacterium]|nr:nucleotidyltransferase family protein [Actinomycetota bacterium]
MTEAAHLAAYGPARSSVPDPLSTARWIAAFGLPGTVPGERAVASNAWPATMSWLGSQRLTGLGVAALEAGALTLEDADAERLLDRHRAAMTVALELERRLLEVTPSMEDAGIEFLVLKGPAVARAFFPDPSWRSFGDLDLLVRTADWQAACIALATAGFRRRLPEPRRGFDERFGKAATHVGPGGVQIDLHRTLVLGPFGLWLEPEGLFEGTTELSIGGHDFRRLDDTRAFLHACMHAALGSRMVRLVPLRDVAQIAAIGAVEWSELDRLADRWRLRAVVRRALEEARATLGFEPPSPARLFLEAPIDHREQRALDAYLTDRRSRGGTARSTLRAIPGLGAKAAYLRALVVPDREFVKARDGGRRSSYLHRWLVPLRWFTSSRGPRSRG